MENNKNRLTSLFCTVFNTEMPDSNITDSEFIEKIEELGYGMGFLFFQTQPAIPGSTISSIAIKPDNDQVGIKGDFYLVRVKNSENSYVDSEIMESKLEAYLDGCIKAMKFLKDTQ
jgi:hypothetical protein